MKSIKQQFSDFRATTPLYVQWLLLVAAFIVVIILLAMLLNHKSNKADKIDTLNQQVSFEIVPQEIDLTNVIVGESESRDVTIYVNTPVVIDSISIDVADITTANNCDNLTDSCLINVVFRPNDVYDETQTNLEITWHVLSEDVVTKTEYVPVVYSAIDAFIDSIDDEDSDENTVIENPDELVDIDIPDEEIDDDVQVIVPTNSFRDDITPDITPIADTRPNDIMLPSEKCSDFAIPGYNQSGIQIGWIKPERGANYFHPFSDKTCSNPTGKYDFATGIITSLRDGSKIGTDANHIGYRSIRDKNMSVPNLSSPMTTSSRASNGVFENAVWRSGTGASGGKPKRFSKSDKWKNADDTERLMGSARDATGGGEFVTSSMPYDRTFILRQFKPIPATIVSEVRADPSVYGCTENQSGQCDPKKNYSIPVRATVDRNVFSDDGRTIIVPTGTLLMGYLSGDLPGPYQAVGRMNIKWYQFIRPDGVEFNFAAGQDPYSADAQGRVGVPGHGSTDYIEQMVMPILTSLVPAAVNMIAPIADTVINQIDLDNNTIVQSGTVRSSEMAKQEVINTWNKVAQKLLVDVMSNTTPPFSIAAGTRINVFSPVDLIVSCEGLEGKKCSVIPKGDNPRRKWSELKEEVTIKENDASWVGQVRSFDLMQYCKTDSKTGKYVIDTQKSWLDSGYDYRTIYAYCESQNYQAINNAKQAVYNQNVKSTAEQKYGNMQFNQTTGTLNQSGSDEQIKAYNQEVLGLKYNDDDTIMNPFAKPVQDDVLYEEAEVLTCDGDVAPDANGCCPGETFEDMGPLDANNPDGPHEYACCPAGDGDCFPPINVQ